MSKITLSGITKRFSDVVALKGIDLEVKDGSFTTLLGPSGCGKTTLLRSLSGLETPDEGKIKIQDKVVFSSEDNINLSSKKRNMGMVFQSYALWPHMNVYNNISYGLKIKGKEKSEMEKIVSKWLEILNMEGLQERYPSELSGGQQQRVAIARMLAMENDVLLMDEPLSNLDAKLRMNMRSELKRLHKELDLTIIYVTHDQVEAMTLSTDMAVMNKGVLEHYGPPKEVYSKPKNIFVADFIGNPQINLISGNLTKNNNKSYLNSDEGFRLNLGEIDKELPDKISIAIRPEDIDVVPDENGSFEVLTLLNSGPDIYINLQKNNLNILARKQGNTKLEVGDKAHLSFSNNYFNIYDTENENLLKNIRKMTLEN